MTDEKLQICNDIQQAILRIEHQLDQADKIILLPDCRGGFSNALHPDHILSPIDKKIRTYLKSTLTSELNRLKKEFEKL